MEIFASQSQGLQNIYTPFPFTMHLVFCIIATIVYLVQYKRKKSIHYLLLMLAVDATFVTQIYSSETIVTCLFFLEVALLTASAYFSHQYNKSLKEENTAEKAKEKQSGDEQ